eukprot:3631500-Pyramimonas_sp.AAC.2
MRAVVTIIAVLAAAQPVITCGSAPDARGNLRATDGGNMRPQVHLVLQCFIWNYFRIENAVAVRFAQNVRKLPQRARANSSALIHGDSDASLEFHYYGSHGTTLSIEGISGGTRSRIIQCLRSLKPLNGYDEEDLADGSGETQGG